MAHGHVGPLSLAVQNFTPIGARVGIRPQNKKKIHFLVKNRPAGQTLDKFLTVLGDFMRTIILQKYFKVDVIRFTGYGVIAENSEKPRVGHLPRIFTCTL